MKEKFLEALLNCISVSGYEEPVQEVIEEEMRPYADEIRRDEMENLVCIINPASETRIMLSAHADEIGLMISYITKEGRLQAVARGGILPATYPGQQVCIRTKRGVVYGVVEGWRELYKKPDLSTKDLVIDIGAEDKEDALRYVAPGDPVVLDTHIRKLTNGRISARGLDDRLGVFIIMEALKRAKERGCAVGVYGASTAGEETVKTGAYWTSERIRPALAIVVDVTYAGDCLGMEPSETGMVTLGGGPALCNSPIVAKKLNERMEVCAQRAGILLQREAASHLSYTDGDKIHFSNQGVPTVLVSIPLRYMHTPAEVADLKDVKDCIELIAEFLVSYDK